MLQNISYIMILGKPVVIWLGFIALFMFILAASTPVLMRKHIKPFNMGLHKIFAKTGLGIAIVHATLIILATV
ncbi:MAG: hypothetical protein V1859_10355 [archaeon]